MSSRDEPPTRTLRVPAALAVAFVGSSAMVSIWYGGCAPSTPDPVPDAGQLEIRGDSKLPTDAAVLDGAIDGSIDGPVDGSLDAGTADAPLDAAEPPH